MGCLRRPVHPRPLGPLFDIADKLGGGLLDACRSGAARDQLFSALLRAIDVPGRLTVLTIEDVHWADESTLDLLRFLGPRVRDLPAMIIATYRDDELPPDHPLRLVLGELATLRSTRRVSIPPLSEAAVGVLADGCGIASAATGCPICFGLITTYDPDGTGGPAAPVTRYYKNLTVDTPWALDVDGSNRPSRSWASCSH